MSIYIKQHYEDVAQLLKGQASSAAPLNWIGHIAEVETNATVKRIACRFADLFAADNPPGSRCWHCGDSKEVNSICTRPNEGHRFGGFDRKQFLEACGLEPEQPDVTPSQDASSSMLRPSEGPPYKEKGT